MMFHANIFKRLRSDVVMITCYFINRTPTEVHKKICPFEELHQTYITFLADPKQYQCLVGQLIYLNHPWPELRYAIHILTQVMHVSKEAHLDAENRVVRDLKGSSGQGILLSSNSDLSLTVYCDSHWNACFLTKRLLSAYVVMLGGSPISCKAKKKTRWVSLSLFC